MDEKLFEVRTFFGAKFAAILVLNRQVTSESEAWFCYQNVPLGLNSKNPKWHLQTISSKSIDK